MHSSSVCCWTGAHLPDSNIRPHGEFNRRKLNSAFNLTNSKALETKLEVSL